MNMKCKTVTLRKRKIKNGTQYSLCLDYYPGYRDNTTMKLSDGSIPATKPGKRYCLYRDELDKWLESSRKNPVPLSDEELNESISSSHRRKPNKRNW